MSDDHHYHRYAPFQPKPDQVMALNVDGVHAACGCAAVCGCTPNVAKIPKQYYVPTDASSVISLQELSLFVDEVNHILERTYIPPLPLLFLHFCIPFSPVCIMSCFASSRQKALRELVDAKNSVMKNCHWELNSDAFQIPNYPLLSLISHNQVRATSTAVAPLTTAVVV